MSSPSPRTNKCPFSNPQKPQNSTIEGTSNKEWWPEQLNLNILSQHNEKTNPIGGEFDYAAAFESLDLNAVKRDLRALMTDSQDWWPADYGHYGPFFIRMAWHAAGTYRTFDGRGGAGSGQLRFAPLNSWPDNGNLDKARRLLWPIKRRYGQSISWADLIILTGNVALESMGFHPFGFAGGRQDVWEPEDDTNWGSETTWLTDSHRYPPSTQNTPRASATALHRPLSATQMGLIYVNPEGPSSNPSPPLSAHDIRTTFSRMAMSDSETVALIAGGHSFGKCHGAVGPEAAQVGPEPEGAPLEKMGLGWESGWGTGRGRDAVTSGLEGAWTREPVRWTDGGFFEVLLGYEWELGRGKGGAWQWRPKGGEGRGDVPDAFVDGVTHAPIMLTTDLALVHDPVYKEITLRFANNPKEFRLAFAKAWYKLTHRDMGPHSRCLGPEVPPPQLWQDPIPPPNPNHPLPTPSDITLLKHRLLNSNISPTRLISTAWASASTFRNSDKRGGANGARIRLLPQREWNVNHSLQLDTLLPILEDVQKEFSASSGKYISIADLIVLGGCAAVETAAQKAGYELNVPFTPGRTDATQQDTDVESFQVLEPRHDGFRNYLQDGITTLTNARPEQLLVDQAYLLNLTAPEMTVLVGGMRALGINTEPTPSSPPPNNNAFTNRPGQLTNDFFVNLLDMDTIWTPAGENLYHGHHRKTKTFRGTATRVDLVFGSHSVLRALAEVYAVTGEGREGMVGFGREFGRVFGKVMDLDRFDVVRAKRRGGRVRPVSRL